MEKFPGILSLSVRGKKEGGTGMLFPGFKMMDCSFECPACQKVAVMRHRLCRR